MLEVVDYEDVQLLPPQEYDLHWTDYEDTHMVCSLLHDRREILEIGTFLGHTCENICRVTHRDARITTVDITKEILPEGLEYQDHEILDEQDSGREIALKHEYKVNEIKAFSDDFFASNTQTFDAIFIDGDHSYEQVRKDTENALRVLKPGGILIWHDVYNKDGVGDHKCQAEPNHNDTRIFLEQEFPFTAKKIGRSWVAFYEN